MMTTIDRLSPGVSSSLKRFFCILVKQSFWHKFGFQCPQSLHRIKDLSFLPHLIKSTVPWRHIRICDLQNYFQLCPEHWDDCISSHELKLKEHPQLIRVGNDLLNYRIEVRQALPTRLKTAFSWNMNSWQGPKSCREDQKMRRIKNCSKSALCSCKKPSGTIIKKRYCYSIFQDFRSQVRMQCAPTTTHCRVVLQSCFQQDG